MIFFPEKKFYESPEDYGLAYEEVQLAVKSSQNVQLTGWFLPCTRGESKPVLLFFHGNAGNIGNRLYKIRGWIERGFNVFLIDYRGYGKSTGKIQHEQDVIEDARAALEWLFNAKKVPLTKVVLYGESLGSYPAVFLGAEQPVAAVVLEAPFTSLYEVAKTHYPFVMEGMMKPFRFSNTEKIAALKAPFFILHGTEDEICPYAMAGDLFDKAPEPKGFLSVPGGRHNDLPLTAGDDFYQKPYEFLAQNAPGLFER